MQSIVINLSVCQSVHLSVSVCLRAYLWNHWTDRHKILSADALWLWLGPPLAAWQYNMYFCCYGWCHVWLQWVWCRNGGCTVQRCPWAVWRYLGGVWCLWMLVYFGIKLFQLSVLILSLCCVTHCNHNNRCLLLQLDSRFYDGDQENIGNFNILRVNALSPQC